MIDATFSPATTNDTIQIGRLAYRVELKHEGNGYFLLGARGAVYATMRNVARPWLLFVVSLTGSTPRHFTGLWLMEKDGGLVVSTYETRKAAELAATEAA